ncbi:hypothetical protein GCM10010519_35600 [Streptomyces lactacystinicus]
MDSLVGLFTGGDMSDVDARCWSDGLAELHERFGHRFARSEARDSALAYMRGLLAPLERKSGWTVAEEAGHGGPDRIQRLLNRIDRDADGVLDDVREYVVEHLADPGGVLIVDDTGFLKKGVRSAGVRRQYSGTPGRTENCQVGVFLAYSGPLGRTLIDRALYLPKSWTDDRERCRAAGIGDEVESPSAVLPCPPHRPAAPRHRPPRPVLRRSSLPCPPGGQAGARSVSTPLLDNTLATCSAVVAGHTLGLARRGEGTSCGWSWCFCWECRRRWPWPPCAATSGCGSCAGRNSWRPGGSST